MAEALLYNGNTNTGGSVPVDASSPYAEGATVTVLANSGSLVKTGYRWIKWNTAANGSGTDYDPADTFEMPAAPVTLYAQWEETFSLTYDANGGAADEVPTDSNAYIEGEDATVAAAPELMVRSGYTFAAWNTAADGSGDDYEEDDPFSMPGEDATLYARWTEDEDTVEIVPADLGPGVTGGAGGVVSFTGNDILKITPAEGNILLVVWNTAAQMKSLTFQPTNIFQGDMDTSLVQVVPAAESGTHGWVCIRLDTARLKLADGTIRCETSADFSGFACAFRLL